MQESVNDRLLEWFCTGETGVSSIAIASTVAGHPCTKWGSHPPADAWDLRRCILLLHKVPEAFERGVLVLATKNAGWAVLAASWHQLEKTLLSELGNDLAAKGNTPRTYRLMRALQDGTRSAA